MSSILLKNTCPVVKNIILAWLSLLIVTLHDLLGPLSFLFPEYSNTFSNLDKPIKKNLDISGLEICSALLHHRKWLSCQNYFDILCSSSQVTVMFTFRSTIQMVECNLNITLACHDDPCYHAITVQDPGIFQQ